MRSRIVLLALTGLLFASCSEEVDVLVPEDNSEFFTSELKPMTPTMRSAIEGVYRVVKGQETFGDLVALKWSASPGQGDTTHYLSGFFGKDVAYFILQGGTLDSVVFLNGYWRKMVNTETGLIRMVISSSRGGDLLFEPSPVVGRDSIIISGNWGEGNNSPSRAIVLAYERPLYTGRRLDIVAHRAGGRTADRLPVSENSVEMVLFTERMGSTGIEIDVYITKDGVPVLYHDTELNLRLTQKNGLVGPIEEYTYTQLQTFVRLIHGERIPTLQEALDAVVYKTSLRVVWLDSKAPAAMTVMRNVQKEYLAKAAAAGRSVDILIGLPTQDAVDEFLRLPDYREAPSLCELDIEKVRQVNARVWAPRWTEGTQNALVAQMQAEGRRAFVWTLDEPNYVAEFISTGNFDAILSNYPSIVAYNHYVRQ